MRQQNIASFSCIFITEGDPVDLFEVFTVEKVG